MKDFRLIGKKIFNKLTVGQKVMSVIIVEILSYTVITTIAIFQIHIVGDEVKQMANTYLPLFSATETIRRQVQDKQISLKDVIFVGGRVVYDKKAEETYIGARARFLTASLAIEDELENAQSLINLSVAAASENTSILEGFQSEIVGQISKIRFANRLNTNRVSNIFGHVEDGSFLMGMERLGEVAKSEERFLDQIDQLDEILISLKSASVDYTVGVERASSLMTLMASFLTVCIVIAVFFFMVRRNISNPLHTLTDQINSFDVKRKEQHETEEDHKLRMRGDELGMVAQSFERLKHDLWAQDKELRDSKEAAERADRAKSQFLAAASHDLRQPLHAMQMYLAALKHRLENKDNLDTVAKVESVSITAGRLLNSLLDVSQLESGAITPQFEEFAVQELLRRVNLSFAPAAQHKQLTLKVVPSSAWIKSDPALLERIVGNYLSNAIRYTESGTILLGCRPRGDKLSIQVWDTGIGIPGKDANSVFEDFVQLHNDERDRGKGLGLGLAIARRIGQCLDHTIESKSQVGKGSFFGVTVDISEHREKPEGSIKLPSLHLQLDNTHVLLVEDDNIVGKATTQLLTAWGCQVTWAKASEEALEIISNNGVQPDIILADYRLPGEHDGVQVSTALQLAIGNAVPAIIITGESELNEIRELSDLGYTVLRKPVRPAKLRSLINHHLSKAAETRSKMAISA